MCGIAGFVGSSASERGEALVRRMLSSLSRRGPNDEGLDVWNSAVLGHRRLSIFDVSAAGHQPMLSDDRSVGIVFNGAIYNFHELRTELESAGYRFRSNTDTEVLVHGYREWGIHRLVSRLRGMFALGIWDDRASKLFLVRDRLGVKPLLYVERQGGIAFASTARALHAAGLAGEIDPQAVTEFLEYGYVTDERSIYEGVRKVPAGSLLEWSSGQLKEHIYWSLPEVNDRGPSFEEAVEETERIFLKAVELRLQADVPVGALLSGGIDSSLICWATRKLGSGIHAFTIGAPGDPSDEAGDARETARELRIDHQVIEMNAEQNPDLHEMVNAYGEPFACASSLGMLRVSRAVKPYATVLLTGDGGDDVFLGYPEHKYFWMAQQWANRTPAPIAPFWPAVRALIPRSGLMKRGANFLDYMTGGLGAVARIHDGLPVYERAGVLGERLAGRRIPFRQIPSSLESARRLLPEFLQYDRKTRFVGEYMTKVDGSTMYYALEARAPFLDNQLWDFRGRLPYSTRLHGGTLKAVLRELARRRIGERVARGAKRGFGIPVQRWIAGEWAGSVREALQNSILAREGWIRSELALQMLERAQAAGWAPNQLWYLFVLEQWMK